jgi:hypothetical protein
MNEMFFQLMIAELSGERFTNFGLNQLAQTQCGEVTGSQQYLKLSERLYEPNWRDRFLAK